MNKLSYTSTGLTVSPQSENVSFRTSILLHSVHTLWDNFFVLLYFIYICIFPLVFKSIIVQRMTNVLPTNFEELKQQKIK